MICKIPTLKKLGFLILTALLVTMTVSCDSQILLKIQVKFNLWNLRIILNKPRHIMRYVMTAILT